jgi:hypothetical protein
MKIIFFLLIVMAGLAAGQDKSQQLKELERRIAVLDSLQMINYSMILRIPDDKQLRELAIKARDINQEKLIYIDLLRSFTQENADSTKTDKKPPH